MTSTTAEPAISTPTEGVKNLANAVVDGYYTPLKGLQTQLQELEYVFFSWVITMYYHVLHLYVLLEFSLKLV